MKTLELSCFKKLKNSCEHNKTFKILTNRIKQFIFLLLEFLSLTSSFQCLQPVLLKFCHQLDSDPLRKVS